MPGKGAATSQIPGISRLAVGNGNELAWKPLVPAAVLRAPSGPISGSGCHRPAPGRLGTPVNASGAHRKRLGTPVIALRSPDWSGMFGIGNVSDRIGVISGAARESCSYRFRGTRLRLTGDGSRQERRRGIRPGLMKLPERRDASHARIGRWVHSRVGGGATAGDSRRGLRNGSGQNDLL